MPAAHSTVVRAPLSQSRPIRIRVAGYFTNGFSLGMRAGDVLFAVDTDASPLSIQAFVVNAATATQTDVSDGLAITATDTD